MVHPARDCILSNKYILNTFLSLSLIIIYLYFDGNGFVVATEVSDKHDNFHEDLYLKPLDDGRLLAHFQFITTYRKDIKNLRWENKLEILPLSVVDLITTTSINELHFSLTKGNWDYKNWGYSVRSSPPGAQIRAVFGKHSKNLDEAWQRLTNSLAGKFCSSLASANEQIFVMPKFSFDNPSKFSSTTSPNDANSSSQEHVVYANLPEETFCTGNLTPWKKLLPCYSNSGLASLLNPINLFKSTFSSLAVDLEPLQCADKYGDYIPECERVQLKQSIVVVFNPLQQFEGKQSWSLAKIFGSSIKKVCPVAGHSRVHVDISGLDDKSKLYPERGYQECSLNMGISKHSAIRRQYATFDLKSFLLAEPESLRAASLNVGIKQNHLFKRPAFSSRKPVAINLRTHVAGLGAHDGTLIATITNSLNEPVRVTYMDIIPHFLRLYMHTLQIRLTKSGQDLKPDRLNYVLSRDDTTPTLIELSMVVPAESETQISYDFERAFLRWYAFKPDANKGVLLSSAMISVSTRYHRVLEQLAIPLCSPPEKLKALEDRQQAQAASNNNTTKVSHLQFIKSDNEMVRIYAKPLLIILPTPDFSMPYNVLCLVCTVLVFAFGPIYNFTIRRPIVRRKKKHAQDERSKKTR